MADYSLLDRVMHRLALGSSIVPELTFDLEKTIYKSTHLPEAAVYVTGLARAGTTALMRGLYSTGSFASLTYDDMPFVLAPNIWGKLSSFDKKQRRLVERAHQDGIMVNFDSPEALEEVFWRVVGGNHAFQDGALHLHEAEPQVLKELRCYQSLVCRKYGRTRYLAKNNNHVLRLFSLASLAPDMKFLVLFRHPAEQSKSLLNQHLRFLNAESFTIAYMKWLTHHDFGATHLPFPLPEIRSSSLPTTSQEYWLLAWHACYNYLLTIMNEGMPNVIPVSYERLCESPEYWQALCQKLDVPVCNSPFENRRSLATANSLLCGYEEALKTYEMLDAKTVEAMH